MTIKQHIIQHQSTNIYLHLLNNINFVIIYNAISYIAKKITTFVKKKRYRDLSCCKFYCNCCQTKRCFE